MNTTRLVVITTTKETLKGSSLEGFTFLKMLEISHADDDGKKTKVIGLSANLDKDFANAFVDGPGHYRFDEVMVVAKGDHAYVLREASSTLVLNEKDMKAQIRKHALKKLSPVHIDVLGL